MFDVATDYIAFMPEPGDGQTQFVSQLRGSETHQVPELHPREVSPDTLVRVGLESIAGQGLDLDASGTLRRPGSPEPNRLGMLRTVSVRRPFQ